MKKMLRGAERFGAQTKMAEVRAVRLNGAVKEIETAGGTRMDAR